MLEISSLPSLPLEKRAQLPDTQAIYFVVTKAGDILYIGCSLNLLVRWRAHHKMSKLQRYQDVYIKWLRFQGRYDELCQKEKKLIDYYLPPLNGCLGRPPKKNALDASLSFKLPADLLRAAQEMSEKTGIAVSFVLRKALEKWIRSEGRLEIEPLTPTQIMAGELPLYKFDAPASSSREVESSPQPEQQFYAPSVPPRRELLAEDLESK